MISITWCIGFTNSEQDDLNEISFAQLIFPLMLLKYHSTKIFVMLCKYTNISNSRFKMEYV